MPPLSLPPPHGQFSTRKTQRRRRRARERERESNRAAAPPPNRPERTTPELNKESGDGEFLFSLFAESESFGFPKQNYLSLKTQQSI